MAGAEHPHLRGALTILLHHLQQLGLQRLRQAADLVEKEGRPLGLLEQTGVTIFPEQLQVEGRPGNGGTVDGVQRPITPLARLIERLRHRPLAGTGRPHDQHGHLHGGDAVRLDQQLLQLGIAGQDQRLPLQLLLRAGQAEGLLYGGQQLILVDGLGQKAEHPGTGRLNGIGDGAVGGHDDDRQAEPLGLDPLEQRQPIHATHAQVTQHQIGALLPQAVERPLRTVGGIHFITLTAQAHAHQFEQADVVIHQQDPAHGTTSRCSFSLRWLSCSSMAESCSIWRRSFWIS